MNGKSILAVALSVAILAVSAQAQVKKGGKVHYDQALPPEAVNQARTEFNTKSGAATAEVDRALTAEERAALEAQAASAADAAKLEEERKRQEEVMMATYSSENDLRRA